MNSPASLKMQPDDPRLTAFALGELEGAERAHVAAAVAADPALQAAVDEINLTVAQLTAALASEPAPVVAPIELPAPSAAVPRRVVRPPMRARLFQFPYVAIGSLAAACFAIAFLILNQNEHAVREAARRTAAVAPEPKNDRPAVTLAPPAAESAAPALIPDTPPLLARDAGDMMIAPSPDAPVLSAAENPAAHVTVAVATTITESPNPTPVPVYQTQATTSQANTGLGHDGRSSSTPALSDFALTPAAAPAPTHRSFAGQAPLPPSTAGTRTAGATEATAGYYADLLNDDVATGDHLRLTFRDFGTRYARNRAAPADGAGATTTSAVAVATNPSGGAGATGPAGPTRTEPAQRTAEENPKVNAPRTPRLPFSETPSGGPLRDELNDRGTINQGRQIADLETQLRDLQSADGSLDSPVQDFVRDNAFVAATDNPASVFPVVVDAASHVSVRRALLAGARPVRDTVRIEELLNSHAYDYAAPAANNAGAFAASLEVVSAPWAPAHRLVRVGLKAREIAPAARPAGHFVLLVETGDATTTSDSQLALLKDSLREFVTRLGPQDQVAIAQHTSTASLVLPTTPARERDTILAAIDQLHATAAATGATGLQLAYDIARSHFVAGGINRVILASDGDTRIGENRREDAMRLIDAQARVGIVLSAVGFGVRDLRDSMLESIAHRGSGEFAFVDTPRDARHALSDRADGAFTTVARNVKLQVEFNPTRVQSWRLIGYEDRVFLREDFDHESFAADAVGAGHTVTALFEIVPLAAPTPSVDDTVALNAEMLSVKIRYTAPGDDTARLQQFALIDSGRDFADASGDFKFAAAVAGFGMLLRESPHRGTATFTDVATWAHAGLGADRTGSRAEFLDLVDRAGRVVR